MSIRLPCFHLSASWGEEWLPLKMTFFPRICIHFLPFLNPPPPEKNNQPHIHKRPFFRRKLNCLQKPEKTFKKCKIRESLRMEGKRGGKNSFRFLKSLSSKQEGTRLFLSSPKIHTKLYVQWYLVITNLEITPCLENSNRKVSLQWTPLNKPPDNKSSRLIRPIFSWTFY